MYYYLYDTYLQEPKYEKILDHLKTRLLDFEIQGKNEKLTLLKNVDELINDEVKRGVDTLVVVGNDKTFLKVVDAVVRNNLTLGIVPVGQGNNIASLLGIGNEDEACEILSARKVVNLDVGKANGQYFFNKISVNKNLERISVERGAIKITPRHDCGLIEINNFYVPENGDQIDENLATLGVQDGILDLLFFKKNKKRSWFAGKKNEEQIMDSLFEGDLFKIKSFEYLPVLLDGYKVQKTPVEVMIEKQKLKVIVGKNRLSQIN
ncbi:MAG: diacylglycerol kinase family protein [Patescibacteria group bacterium]